MDVPQSVFVICTATPKRPSPGPNIRPGLGRQATRGAALFSWEPGTASRGMRCRCARVRPAPDTTPQGPPRDKQEEAVNAPGLSIDPARAGGLRMLRSPPSRAGEHSTPTCVPATCGKRLITIIFSDTKWADTTGASSLL